MALFAFCWLIIELKIIPNGFLKWFYLSFYIHPMFLFFCQIFLWLNELQKWVLLLILLPFKITLFITLSISKFLKRLAVIFFSFALTKSKIFEFFADQVGQQDGGDVSLQEFESGAATGNTSDRSSTLVIANRPQLMRNSGRNRRANLAQPELQSSRTSWLNEFLLSDHYTKYVSTHYSNNAGNLSSHGQKDSLSDTDILHPNINQGFSLILQDFEPRLFLDEEMLSMSYGGEDLPHPTPYVASDLSQTNGLVDEYSPSPCSSDSPIIPLEQEQQLSSKVLEKDAYSCSFHKKYTERMRWFEVLYHDRLCGIRHPIQHMMIPSAKNSRLKILRSLESDLELVYVAELCLIWEALHYQYRKVECLAALSDDILLFHADISEKFQKFRIILERFMEDEKCHEDKKYLDFICDRISFKGLLQIPDVIGCVKKEENRRMVGEVMMKANEVLKVVEKCIQVFRLYVERDHKKEKKYVRRIFKEISWRTRPPVEDPRDLHLLYDLTNALRKKLQLLNGMQAKNKCWYFRRRVKPVQEESDDKNMDLVFGTIDLELVRKVTKMPTISTSHLTWCQHKLSNVEFKQGRIFRTPTTCLFPSS
ncbi:uncharacterized protein [Primulina huaijiensis]|uniref:uncharacterized protein n=1 Tax=Primulina huaijiensis TaxID=1492673 RepID=UPI003CC78321